MRLDIREINRIDGRVDDRVNGRVNDKRGKERGRAAALPSIVPDSVDAAASVSAKVLWCKAEALERLGGDEDLFREICVIFLEESPKLLDKLRLGIAAADPDAVMRAAHGLRGELGYMSATVAAGASRALENMGLEKNLAQAAEVFVLLERELANLHLAIAADAGEIR